MKEAIYIRVDTERKRRWEDAAALQGVSLTTFLAVAADMAAKTGCGLKANTGMVGNLLADAVQGGKSNYVKVGLVLAELLKFECEDDVVVWDAFVDRFPELADGVPARRRGQFVRGVRQAWAK